MNGQTYIVPVIRTAWAKREIEVQASSPIEAAAKALDIAGEFEFSEHGSEYDVPDANEVRLAL